MFSLVINQTKLPSFEIQKRAMKYPIYEDNEMQKTLLSDTIQIRMVIIQNGISLSWTHKMLIKIRAL
jgi:hypothetical protein